MIQNSIDKAPKQTTHTMKRKKPDTDFETALKLATDLLPCTLGKCVSLLLGSFNCRKKYGVEGGAY